jgi:hypothetical protein
VPHFDQLLLWPGIQVNGESPIGREKRFWIAAGGELAGAQKAYNVQINAIRAPAERLSQTSRRGEAYTPATVGRYEPSRTLAAPSSDGAVDVEQFLGVHEQKVVACIASGCAAGQ